VVATRAEGVAWDGERAGCSACKTMMRVVVLDCGLYAGPASSMLQLTLDGRVHMNTSTTVFRPASLLLTCQWQCQGSISGTWSGAWFCETVTHVCRRSIDRTPACGCRFRKAFMHMCLPFQDTRSCSGQPVVRGGRYHVDGGGVLMHILCDSHMSQHQCLAGVVLIHQCYNVYPYICIEGYPTAGGCLRPAWTTRACLIACESPIPSCNVVIASFATSKARTLDT
jgi:hypothetical protein